MNPAINSNDIDNKLDEIKYFENYGNILNKTIRQTGTVSNYIRNCNYEKDHSIRIIANRVYLLDIR